MREVLTTLGDLRAVEEVVGCRVPARLSAVTFFIWLLAIASGIYFYVARADIVRDEILILSASSSVIAGAVYFIMGCIRGFTLIPVVPQPPMQGLGKRAW